MKLKLSFLITCIVFFARTNAQDPNAFMQSALNAQGDWSKVKSFHYAQKRTSYNKWQQYQFVNGQPNNDNAVYDIDFETGRYRNQVISRYQGGYEFNFVTIGKDSTRYLYDADFSRNGKVLVKQGPAAYTANKGTGLGNLPYYLLKIAIEAKNPFTIQTANDEVSVTREIPNNGSQTFVFDEKNLHLKKIIRVLAQRSERLFSDYTTIDGLLVPRQVVQYFANGDVAAADKVEAFTINQRVDPSLFVIPAVYTEQVAAAPKPLSANEIAKDVFLIEGVGGDRNIVFVSMNDYVVLTEAPLSPDIAKAVIDVVHKTLPGKPIRYVHLSHFHNDHITGIRQLVHEGATIICTPAMQAPIQAILDGELGNFNDDYSKSKAIAKFETFEDLRILSDDAHRVEFREVPNSHVQGMSFMYLPEEQIIYEGDLYSLPEDGTITKPIAVNKEFNDYLLKNKIVYKRMVGHHGGGNITPGMFNTMMKMK
ncbi:MAG: hypothetical protein JWN76_2737 [Chitinophagaceae bacterium]|nr:hypothetical protein [Chitinophagaceae bacterium]